MVNIALLSSLSRIYPRALPMLVAGLIGVPSAAAAASPQIRAEAMVSSTIPYAQQTIVYTVRILSATNVLEFSPDPPTIPGAALELLEEKPRTYLSPVGNGQGVVNEYRYALTPLVAGRIEIPATHLSGKAESAVQYPGSLPHGVAFQVQTQRLSLRSRMVPPSAAQPWLPLQALELLSEGKIERARLGEPFTLSLWLRAIGVRGQRLPSLAERLQGAGFRMYQEKAVEYWQDASADGNAARGQRHETLTVIPLKTGALQLPTVRIPWWDTTKDQQATFEWQFPEIAVVGTTDTDPPVSDRATGWWLIVLITAMALGVGWWRGGGLPTKTPLEVVRRVLTGWQRMRAELLPLMTWLTAQAQAIVQGASVRLRGSLGDRLKKPFGALALPALWTKTERWLVRILPRTFYVWRLLHVVKATDQFESIADALRTYGAAALSLPHNSPLSVIAEAMIANHPTLDQPSVMRLFRQMDAALYGNSNPPLPEGSSDTVDIGRWKQHFGEVMRPLRRYSGSVSSKRTQGGLPPLNPISVAKKQESGEV